MAAIKGRMAAATGEKRPKVLPHPRVIEGYVSRLLDLLDTEPEEARSSAVSGAFSSQSRDMSNLNATAHDRLDGGIEMAVEFVARWPLAS